MILPANHFIVFNSEVNRLMQERSHVLAKSNQEVKDEYLEELLDCPLKLSNIILPE